MEGEGNKTPSAKTKDALDQAREISKPCPDLSEDRKAAERQFKSLWNIFKSTEQKLCSACERISELEKELKMIDRKEIDSLYSTIETLTNELEDKK